MDRGTLAIIKRVTNPKLSILTQSRLLNESISDTKECIELFQCKLGVYLSEDDTINSIICSCRESLAVLEQERIKMNDRMRTAKVS